MKFGRNPRNAGPGKTHSTTIMAKAIAILFASSTLALAYVASQVLNAGAAALLLR